MCLYKIIHTFQFFVLVIYVAEKRAHVYLVVDAMERFAEEHDVALTAMRDASVRVDTIHVTPGSAGKINPTLVSCLRMNAENEFLTPCNKMTYHFVYR